MFLSLVLLFVIYKTFFSIHFLYFGSQLVTHFHVSIPPPYLPISFFYQVVLFPMTLLPVPCPRIENSNLWYEHVCLKNAAFICILSQSYPSINQTLLSASTGCTRIYAATSAGCSIMHKFMPAARDGHRLFEQTKVLRTNKIFREKGCHKGKKRTMRD